MYEGHFQLERRPFAATPDPSCCYLSPTQAPQFENVVRCVEQGRGIAILTGPAGSGKTLLAQVLLTELQSHFTGVYLGTGQFPTRRALLQAILYELGQPYGGMTDQELRLELNTALRNLIAQKDGLLLILDEAHLLADRLLEEVRMLVDLAQHGVPLVRVVLCGNPEFEERLTAPALSAFNQRVACHEPIETLLRSESINYLRYRIQWAGGEADTLFEPGALQLIAEASDGVPRCLNQLAEHSLTQAFLAKAPIATEAIVRQSLAALQHLPLRWNATALLSHSWSSITEPVRASPPVPEAISNSFVSETRSDDSQSADATEITNEPESSCFEFGAGDDSQSAALPSQSNGVAADWIARIENQGPGRETTPLEIASSDTIPSESNPHDAKRVEPCDTDEFESNCYEFGEESDTARTESLDLESVSDESIRNEIAACDSPQQSDSIDTSIEARSADSANPGRRVFVRVALNNPGADKPADAPAVISENRPRIVTQLDEEIDLDQPSFSWLKHRAPDQEPLSQDDSESQIEEETVSEFKLPPKLRVRSQNEQGESDLAAETTPQSSIGRSSQFEAIRQRGFPGTIIPKGGRSEPVMRATSGASEPEEENVVDRYAALDATCRTSVPQPPVLKTPSLPVSSANLNLESSSERQSTEPMDRPAPAAVVIAATLLPKSQPHPGVTSQEEAPQVDRLPPIEDNFEGHPVERIDSICALIETVDDHSNGASGVELITDWGVERVDVDLSSETNSAAFSDVDQQLQAQSDPWIGSTVVEVGRELRHQIQETPLPLEVKPQEAAIVEHKQPDSTPDPKSDSPSRATLYDIVEPEMNLEAANSNLDYRLDPPQNEASSDESGGHFSADPAMRSTTHSRFHNLFSRLRRRQVTPEN